MTLSGFVSTVLAAPPSSLHGDLLARREQTLTQLYQRTFPTVRRLVLRQGGTADDAQDVFQDALVVFYEQVVSRQLALTAAPGTYLVAVSRNLWRRELDRRQRYPSTGSDAAVADVAADAPAQPDADSVLAHVERLGEKCRSVLLSFYYFQQPLDQIAHTHGYRTVRSATVQKFKCLERLRGAVKHLRAELLTA